MLTGESMPVKKVVGNAVIGATINKSGSFRYQATKVGVGTWVGIIVGTVFKLGLAFAMVGLFAISWFF